LTLIAFSFYIISKVLCQIYFGKLKSALNLLEPGMPLLLIKQFFIAFKAALATSQSWTLNAIQYTADIYLCQELNSLEKHD